MQFGMGVFRGNLTLLTRKRSHLHQNPTHDAVQFDFQNAFSTMHGKGCIAELEKHVNSQEPWFLALERHHSKISNRSFFATATNKQFQATKKPKHKFDLPRKNPLMMNLFFAHCKARWEIKEEHWSKEKLSPKNQKMLFP